MSTWQPAATTLVADLTGVFGSRLRSVTAYGPRLEGRDDAPLAALALVTSLTAADLDACSRIAVRWERAGVATPLILPEDEFRTSLDVFPLEYGEIVRSHVHLFGTNPLGDVRISQKDLRHACETQIKSHLLHLREGYIESGGQPSRVARLVTAAAPAFASLLRNVARLHGVEAHDRMEATREGARAVGLSETIVAAVLALEQPGSLPTSDPARLFPDYLAAVEHLAKAVDVWHE